MPAPTRECPGCHQRVHVRKKSCDCGYNFPAYGSALPTKAEKPVDKPAEIVRVSSVRPENPPPTEHIITREQQEYYRRVRQLEELRSEDAKKLNFLVSLTKEMLKVCKAFNDVPRSLALMLENDKWFGMNPETREVRPIDDVKNADISFALNGDNHHEVKAAPWEDEVFATN